MSADIRIDAVSICSSPDLYMSNTLPLLRGTVSLSQALSNDDNILAQIVYPQQRQAFYNYLYAHTADIEAVVSSTLRVKGCRVSGIKTWISGSYNVCVPVHINPPSDFLTVLVRIPLPYKVGDSKCPGNGEEKLRCEVASYIWTQENCPDVPIPVLFGFGFQNGLTVCLFRFSVVILLISTNTYLLQFTTPRSASFFARWK